MTDLEKATELGIKYQTPCHGIGDCEFEARQAALEMAKWKEKQMIDKFINYIKEHPLKIKTSDIFWDEEKFKQEIKG